LTAYHLTHYPNSLASQYLKIVGSYALNRLGVLYDLVKRWPTTPATVSQRDWLVVHLRCGDVIDRDRRNVSEVIHRGNYYVKPLTYYQQKMATVANHEISKVVLVSGDHKRPALSPKSMDYINAIRNLFNRHNYLTTLRLNGNPDEDFVFMSRSHLFLPSGGGYSKLISEMVTMHHQTCL